MSRTSILSAPAYQHLLNLGLTPTEIQSLPL